MILPRDQNIEEKKAMFKISTGEDYPEEYPNKVKRKPRKKVPQVIASVNLRKSLRKVKIVNYKEHVGYLISTSSSRGKRLKPQNTGGNTTETNVKTEKTQIEVFCEEQSDKVCELCKEDLKTSSKLRIHFQKYHKRILFNCPVCQLPMFSKANLKKHYKMNHTK